MTDGFSRDPMTAEDHTEKVPKTATEAIQQVVMAIRILSNEGILDALGHVSLRTPSTEIPAVLTKITAGEEGGIALFSLNFDLF